MPCTLDRAKRFVDAHHRHHTAKIQAVFCVAVADDTNTVRGVAMVGWPVARHYSDGVTIEVNRVATDGCKNACSALLGACRRIAFELGYRRIITYTLHEEGGGESARRWMDSRQRIGGWFGAFVAQQKRAINRYETDAGDQMQMDELQPKGRCIYSRLARTRREPEPDLHV